LKAVCKIIARVKRKRKKTKTIFTVYVRPEGGMFGDGQLWLTGQVIHEKVSQLFTQQLHHTATSREKTEPACLNRFCNMAGLAANLSKPTDHRPFSSISVVTYGRSLRATLSKPADPRPFSFKLRDVSKMLLHYVILGHICLLHPKRSNSLLVFQCSPC
jgi:hypothetical protein